MDIAAKNAPLDRKAKQLDNARKQFDLATQHLRNKAEVKQLLLNHMNTYEDMSLKQQQQAIQKLQVLLAQKGMTQAGIAQILSIIGTAVLKK